MFRSLHQQIRERLTKWLMPNGVTLDYPPQLVPRWGEGKLPHPELYAMFDCDRKEYAALLSRFSELTAVLAENNGEISWNTGWFDALDAIALYSMTALRRPANYLEIGSGISTKFARKAVRDFGLATNITSVDPQPRAEIDAICNEIIRVGLEDADPAIFERLVPGDFLFMDGSHRTLMNSDCTVFFLEVLPRLKPGVIVHIHDIFLPSDYPTGWRNLYYSEQYLLAAYLLAGEQLKILLPNAFASTHKELLPLIRKLFIREEMGQVGGWLGQTNYLGSSFWCEVR